VTQTKRRNYKKQATDAWGVWVRSRGYCQSDRPEHKGYLQAAHIISRSYGATRTDPENGLCLCAGCHLFYTNRPIEWEDWVEFRWPGLLDELKQKARTHAKVNWRIAADYWKQAAEGVEAPTSRLV
jgi:5-methylcytosine-specific restriction endonuclease McrA